MKQSVFLETSSLEIWDEFSDDLARLEKHRVQSLIFVGGVFLSLFLGSLLMLPPENAGMYILVTFIIASMPTLWAYKSMRRGQWLRCKPVSHLIVRRLLGDAYRAWGIIETDDIIQHGILPAHCRLYREEGYSVNIHGYAIKFQEIDTVRSSHHASVREWNERSVGSGLYIDIRLKRMLPAHTILLSKNLNSFLKRFIKKHFSEYKPVGLVSPRFQGRYDVYTTDQVEARVAFHPAFMEKFMEIADCLNAQSVEASFKRTKLLIHARYKKDLFQLGRFLRPITIDDIDNLKHELKLYGDILAILKLNPYTAP